MSPDTTGRLTVYAHLGTERAQVEHLLAALNADLGPHPGRSSGVALSAVRTGQVLEIYPMLDDVRCVPARQEVVWHGRLEQVSFALEYVGTAAEATCDGTVRISVDGLLIGQVPMSIRVEPGSAVPPVQRRGSATMIRTVFASYAHEDEAFVRRCKAAYRGLGINVFVDRDDIRGGQGWQRVITDMIANHDLFQLYWSDASAGSQHVAKEWGFALQVARSRPDGTEFVRPLYWSRPMPKPPELLKPIHFAYVDPQSLGLGPSAAGMPEAGAVGGPRRCEASFPVVALTPGRSPETVNSIRAALPAVVPFIEDVTGLRYHPPITLLVDDHAVSQARRSTEAEPGVPDEIVELRAAVDLLQALLLVFHMRQFTAEHGRDAVDEVFGLSGGAEQVEFEFLRHRSEGLGNTIRRHLAGEDVVVGLPGTVPEFLGKVSPSLDGARVLPVTMLPTFVELFVARIVDYVGRVTPVGGGLPFRGGFPIGEDAVAYAKRAFPWFLVDTEPLNLRTDQPRFGWTATPSDYRDLLAGVAGVVVDGLRTRGATLRTTLFTTAALTYGAFTMGDAASTEAIGRGAADQGVPRFVVPAGPAILICADAFERVTTSLTDAGMARDAVRTHTNGLLGCTVVHEHLHAAVATGLDRDGYAAPAAALSRSQAWQCVNEALAAWAQSHFVRSDQALYDACSAYIRYGEYPDWPYRGAEAVERMYQQDGLQAVRALVAQLRADPEGARRRLDEEFNS
ncbi:hypothetical protein GCM10009558_062660 [Virgisporangium aurantiacum]